MPTYGYRPRARSWRNYRPPRLRLPGVGGPPTPPDIQGLRPTPTTRTPPVYQMPPPPFVAGGQPGGVAPGGVNTAKPPAAPQKTLAQQAQDLIHAQIDPILAEIKAEIEARGQASSAAIQGLTANYAQNMQQYAASGSRNLRGAALARGRVDPGALRPHPGAGPVRWPGPGGILEQAGQSPGAAGGIDLAAEGAGAGNANFATGSAAIEQLIANQAAAQNYAGQLPGIASLTGLQATKDLQLQLGQASPRAWPR